MDDIEKIIKERHSVRNYLDMDISESKINTLNELILECNKEANLNIQLVVNDREVFDRFILKYGRLKNAKNYIAMIGKKSVSLDEKIGYYGEKIVLKAQQLGLNTCWVGGTYRKGSVRANIGDSEKLVCIIAIGYGENQGSSRRSKKFNDVSISKDVPEWYKKGIEYSLLAPTAMNQQKFKFEYLGDNKVRAIRGVGAMTKIDLGIVKYHFELGAKNLIDWY